MRPSGVENASNHAVEASELLAMSEGVSNGEKAPVNVYEFLAVMVDQVAAIAWQKMGLQPDFVTGKIEKDMTQCKAAVDAVAALAQIVDPQLDDNDKRQMQNLVRDLRMNFVEHNS